VDEFAVPSEPRRAGFVRGLEEVQQSSSWIGRRADGVVGKDELAEVVVPVCRFGTERRTLEAVGFRVGVAEEGGMGKRVLAGPEAGLDLFGVGVTGDSVFLRRREG
jgi:hypothetical protein